MIAVPSPPADDSPRPVAFFDTECYWNYWLLKVRPLGGATVAFRLYPGQRFDPATRDRIVAIFQAFRVISFNGLGYDVPQITLALIGGDCAALKTQSDRIIKGGVRAWQLDLPEWKPVDHIDIMEVCPGAGSQKMFAARIHSRRIQDLPFDPDLHLDAQQIAALDAYCENDLDNLADLFRELAPQIRVREKITQRYGIDVRSKSDAQIAEAVLRARCQTALGRRIYKPEIDWNLAFRFEAAPFLQFVTPQLQHVFDVVRAAMFRLGPTGSVAMPPELEGLTVQIGKCVYRMGIGGLHSSEKRSVHVADDDRILRDIDVTSYYPSLMLNSGKYPPALGEQFLIEFAGIKSERVVAKVEQKRLEKADRKDTPEWIDAQCENEGGKVQINGTFGKTNQPGSVLFAPQMMIQTTVTGQLAALMLIEWHELSGIECINANTDGMVFAIPRNLVAQSEFLVQEWERRTGLATEATAYSAIYSRDVNNYFAVKADGEVKRKGEYAPASLLMKKSPDLEICSDAVAEFLARGTPLEYTIAVCRDIRKFVTVQKVTGGAMKLHGDGPRKGALVRDMSATLQAHGWTREGRAWRRGSEIANARTAYELCFAPQVPEYLGKTVRWYYGTDTPGPIVSADGKRQVANSWGAAPCQELPETFPTNVDLSFYVDKARSILVDIGKLLV